MRLEFKERVIYYASIFIFLFFQHGLFNINRLGFISDDWDYVRYVTEGINPSLLNLIKFQSNTFHPGFALSRPLSLITNVLHIWLSRANVASYHYWNFFLLVMACILLFEFLKTLLKSSKLAALTVLIYISLPYHTSTYYWVCTRVSVYAMIFALISGLCVQKNSKLLLYFFGPLSLLLSVSGYEIFIGFVPIIAYIIFFTPQFKNHSLSNKLFVLFLYTFSAFGVFLYRKLIISSVLNYSLPKEINLSGFLNNFSRYRFMLSNIFGIRLYRFLISSGESFAQIKTLSYSKLLMFFLITFSYYITRFVFPTTNNSRNREVYSYILHLGIIIITAGLVSLLFTGYNYSLGGDMDRVNIFPDIGISLLIIYLFLNIPKNIAKLFLFFILVFFTMTNWVYLSAYIKAYDYQKAFINYVKTMDIPNNSLIFLETDLEIRENIPAINSTWGLTHLIAYSVNQNRVEYVGDWSSYTGREKYEIFYSHNYRDYTYYNPNIILLKFNESDLMKY